MVIPATVFFFAFKTPCCQPRFGQLRHGWRLTAAKRNRY
jgi:hypothetical protein